MATAVTASNYFAFPEKLPLTQDVLHDPRAEFMRSFSEQSKDTSPRIFIPKTESLSDVTNRIRKIEIGKRYMNPPERVILTVGATGSGKSTLINAMYNYICGVEWEDSFRFKLIHEDNEKSQAYSQTEWITAYVIHHQPWFTVPYTLIFIDTPGLGDTEGIQKDDETREQIRQCFTTTDDHGIDQLDAVALVERATSLRSTPTHRYILESTLSLFGKDIDENIFLLLPFADEGTPAILNTLKNLKVKFKKHFNFNNVGLFCSNACSTPPSARDMIKNQCWEMGRDSFKAFVAELDSVQPRSLKLSAETLNERRQLELAVHKIQNNITSLVYYLQQLSIENQVLQRYYAAIDENENITYKVSSYDPDSTSRPKRVLKTTGDLKNRYADAGEELTAKQLVEKCLEELSRCQAETLSKIQEASQRVARLRQIALRPTPISATDYIEILISKENAERCDGWKQRKRQLRKLKKIAKIHSVVAQNYPVPEKFINIYNEEKRNNILSLSLICQNDIKDRKSAAEQVTSNPMCRTTCPAILHKKKENMQFLWRLGRRNPSSDRLILMSP